MNRIDKTFAALKAGNRKALITYIMAGDPDIAASLECAHELAKHADVLEIGMPFTDPMADGPAIQAAGLRALTNKIGVKEVLNFVQQFRSKNSDTPIVLMGYFNPVLAYGVDKFCIDCNRLGVDGLIIVDIPPEEANEIVPKAQQNNIAFVRLLTPTTDIDRAAKIAQNASGFLYYISIAGVTGAASADPVKVGKHIAALKTKTDLPIVAGFGIKTPADASAMAAIADGVIVGSALVLLVADNAGKPGLSAKLGKLASSLPGAVRGVKNAA